MGQGYEIPNTAEDFNLDLLTSKTNLYNYFWGDIYCSDPDYSFKKWETLWNIWEVNGYYVVATFVDESEDLIDLMAWGTLVEIISANASAFLDKCLGEGYETMIKTPGPEDSKRYYFSNFLYIDADIEPVIEVISHVITNEFLLRTMDGDYLDKKNTLLDLWDPENTYNNDVMYFSASDHDFLGSGLLVGLLNLQKAIPEDILRSAPTPCVNFEQWKAEEYEPRYKVPGIIIQKCRNIPLRVELNFSRAWQYPRLGNKVQHAIASRFEGRAFMISADQNILEVKGNKKMTREEKTRYLYEYTSDYLEDNSLNEIAKDIYDIIGSTWEQLHDNSKKFLATGFSLYRETLRGAKFLMDSSLPSIAYAKCIENEMVEKIVKPFKEYFDAHFADEDMGRDLEDTKLKRMASYLSEEKSNYMEIGAFGYFLRRAITDKERSKWSVSIKAFQSYAATCNKPEFLLEEEKACDMFGLIARKYRNGSAHTKVLPIEHLVEFHEHIFEHGFLTEMIKAVESTTQP